MKGEISMKKFSVIVFSIILLLGSLTSIIYADTEEQWESVTKGTDWDATGNSNTTITFTSASESLPSDDEWWL